MAAAPPDRPSPAAAVAAAVNIPHQLDAPLAPLTWYHLGGPADVLAQPRDIDELARLFAACRDAGVACRVLGAGANLLVDDDGVDGVVVQLTAPGFTAIEVDGPTVTAGAGADLPRLVLETGRHGLAGLDPLAGIPATVGGAIRMNAGGKFGAIGPRVTTLTSLTDAGQTRTLGAADLAFDYRCSNITDPIILRATFDLEPTDPVALRARVKQVFAYKKSTQPLAAHSAGCAFKNPIGQTEASAGALVDRAGLKGHRVGGAEISPRHANFIVVHPGGAARDVLHLIRFAQRRVAERFDVQLQPELVVWSRHETEPADVPY